MEKIDIDALLDKNPQVDREAIKARKERLAKEEPSTIKGNPASPYGGRRATSDDKMKWPARVNRSGRR